MKKQQAKAKSAKPSTKPKKKIKLSAEERKARKIKQDHIRAVRSVFRNAGFDRVPELAEKEIEFRSQRGEFDDCYIYENVILLVEYTTSSPSNVTGHLKNKKIIFDRVMEHQTDFISYLSSKFPAFLSRLEDKYAIERYKIRVVYCSRFDFENSIKNVVDTPIYLDYPVLKYFEKISSIIKLSSRPELLHFLQIDLLEVGQEGIIKKQETNDYYHGSILPEEASGLSKGYKVISFYADANALLQRSFVLRRNGWRSSHEAYQRMMIPTKINAIREKLRTKGQVSINNVIVTLPSDVLAVKQNGHAIDMLTLNETEPVKISLPLRQNSVGLIDGQHRLYSYYQTRDDDKKIAKLRHRQNLLVTGIIYPENLLDGEAERFEAELFLTINSNQSSAPSELRQEIEVILNPTSNIAISKRVMEQLGSSGPLFGYVERFFYDKGKLKTSSIVNFGLIPLLKLSGPDSLSKLFKEHKNISADEDFLPFIDEYVNFCVSNINKFLSAVRSNVDQKRWTSDSKSENRILTVTNINSFLITMRLLIDSGHDLEFEKIKKSLSDFDNFDTSQFRSSQYNRMATKIFEKYFK